MIPRELLLFSVKLLLVWLTLTAILFIGGEAILTPLLPLCRAIMVVMVPEFSPSLKFIHAESSRSLELTVWVLNTLHIHNQVEIPRGIVLNSAAHLWHILLPAVLTLTIVLVWPVAAIWQRLVNLLLGMLTSSLVLLVTMPVLLIALVELPFQEQAQQIDDLYVAPWFMDWMVFSEMGGNLLLAVSGAFLGIVIQQWLLAKKRE